MVLRSLVGLAAVALAAPALVASAAGETLNADQARRFVVGKFFSFTCFEGTVGSGRVFSDGSVAGVVKIQGSGPTRFMHLPPGTLFANGDRVCSTMKGAIFNPCFNLTRTSDKSFRGAISGLGFAYCDFTSGAVMRTAATNEPTNLAPPAPSIRKGKPQTATVVAPVTAAPTAPVTSAPLPPAEQPAIRGTVGP